MLARSLAFTFLIVFSSVNGSSNICHLFLKSKISVLDDLVSFINETRVNQNLDSTKLQKIRSYILQIESMNLDFNRKWTKTLAPYGVSFLPRLRRELVEISNEFQELNNEILSELIRFEQEKRLTNRAPLLRALERAKASIAVAFLNNSNNVYFGLGFFINTFGEKGYLLSKLPREISDRINISVTVIERDLNSSSFERYPMTDNIIPSRKGPDGLSFSGFPLDSKVLNFFKKVGDTSGHINVTYPAIEQPKKFGVFFKRYFSLDVTNWDLRLNRYISFYDRAGEKSPQRRAIILSDPDNYTFVLPEDTGTLMVPVLTVAKNVQSSFNPFNEGTPYYIEVQSEEHADLLLPPNHFEFITALYFLINNIY